MGDARRGVMVTSALAMAAVLAGSGAASASVPTVESTTERVLQAVSVTMGPDGSTTGVGSSVVRTDGSVEDAESTDGSYAPQDVVGDLPVRVLTSWRTADGAGTDLSDLQGYTGRVAIDVTVQNLTVKPQLLSYDAAGVSRRQAALVGSPLTVTASSALGDLAPERIVTDDRDTGVNVTNGVIGRDADGTTVQWAALLAPPTMKPSSEFSLVVDAKNFDVPSFDLSVQPGLVTDPSMGALVDAAFNPASSEELDLQRRTIGLIGDVNVVLSRASETISDVRTNLTSSAETLGTQTVADLQSSTQSVAANMSSLGGALQSLQGDLNSTLESTGSNAVSELQNAVTEVDKLLGDTTAKPPTVKLDGNGCETTVAPPKKGGTVYGSLLQVAGQLDAYAAATDACKGALQESIRRTIGVEDPDAAACQRTDPDAPLSVTCSLYQTQASFEVAANDLRAELLGGVVDGQPVTGVIDLIRPELYGQARAAALAMTGLVTKPAGIKDVTLAIRERRTDIVDGLATGYDSLVAVDALLGDLQTALGSLRTKAGTVRSELLGIQGQTGDAAAKVCDLVEAGTLTFDEARSTLALLVPDVEDSCDAGQPPLDQDANGNPVEPQAVATRLAGQAAVLQTGLDESADSQDALDDARDAVQDGIDAIGRALLKDGENQPNAPLDPDDVDLTDENLKELLRRLVGPDGTAGLLGELGTQSGTLETEIAQIAELAEDVAEIETEIGTKIDQATSAITSDVDGGIEDVLKARDAANGELGTMFDRSVSGLDAASDQVVTDGRNQINASKKSFFVTQQQAAKNVTASIEKGLGQINTGVTSSTRDMEAATALLIADLRKVLLDLGERQVGGGGLLGAMATNAATARQADYQLALAGNKADSYANVRGRDVAGLMLRQEQTDASMRSLLEMPAFQLELPSGSQHRTVYSFRIGDS